MDLQVHYPLKRVRQAHGRRVFHRFQHIYMWVVYLLGMPLWTLHDVILTIASFFTGCFAGLPLTRLQRAEAAAVTAANVSINLILPFLCLEFERAVLLFMVSSVACSLAVILPNVVNHEVPEASEIASRKPMDWGVHQVVTSHNYGTNSRWSLYSSGGLNFQIEHHLFPSVHYSHYPALAEIVRTACNEYGVPYHTSRTLWQALRKHHYLLKLYAAP
jgi:linoleoyl-CoA desaturase